MSVKHYKPTCFSDYKLKRLLIWLQNIDNNIQVPCIEDLILETGIFQTRNKLVHTYIHAYAAQFRIGNMRRIQCYKITNVKQYGFKFMNKMCISWIVEFEIFHCIYRHSVTFHRISIGQSPIWNQTKIFCIFVFN